PPAPGRASPVALPRQVGCSVWGSETAFLLCGGSRGRTPGQRRQRSRHPPEAKEVSGPDRDPSGSPAPIHQRGGNAQETAHHARHCDHGRARERSGRVRGCQQPEPCDRQPARLDHRPARGAGDVAADDRRRPLSACRRRPGPARTRQGLDQGRLDRLRARPARTGAGLDRAGDRRLMRRRAVLVAVAAALALLICAPLTFAAPPAATPAARPAAQSSRGQTTPGIQIGPSAPVPQPPSGAGGGSVSGGGGHGPAWWQFWDVSGQISNAIDGWFRGLVTDALNPMLNLIGKTVLATPQVAGQSAVAQIWLISLGIADGLLVLFLLAAGALLMTNETLHSRYALKDALPRIAFGAIAANASLSLSGQLIAFANALSSGFLAGGVDPAQASVQLKDFILGAVAGSGIFVILLGLVAAALAVVLLILFIVRATVVLILIAGAPVMLITHALP